MDEELHSATTSSSSFAAANIKPLFPASAAGSLFPIFQIKNVDAPPAWLTNASFSESLLPPAPPPPPPPPPIEQQSSTSARDLETEIGGDDVETEKESKKERKRRKEREREEKQRKKQRKKEQAEDTVIGALKGSRSERKASGGIWAGDGKDWYFDFRGDKDNLAFESLYRQDISRYHAHHSKALLAERLWKRRVNLLNPEGDSCSQEESVRTNGRFWSSKVASLERRRDFKRLCFGDSRSKQPKNEAASLCDEFIALNFNANEGEAEKQAEKRVELPLEKSWEDYVIEKTKHFSQLTHDKPGDESVWINFAKFQDELIDAEKRKTMIQHAIDKKILLLEKALEHHPNSQNLILLYLETSKRKDDMDTLVSKWERMIMKHSGNYQLWWEYLKLRKSTFSKFSVSALRKLYSQALQALAAARNRQQKERFSGDDARLGEAEIGIVAIFLDLCRFEWQTGHHELAIGLFQAQFEFSFLCPLIQVSQANKLRLFESFWNSRAPRIGEDGAVGWNSWMQQKEEQIQNAKAMTSHKIDDEGSWSGWKEIKEVSNVKVAESGILQEIDDADEADEIEQDEDDAALLEKLGLNVDLTKDVEVKDARVWKRWSEKESERDCQHWLPVKASSRTGDDEQDDDEGLENMVLFDDIRENLFTLTTQQGKFFLIGRFLEFCNAPLFQWCCSNTLGYKERIDSLEVLTSDVLNGSTDIQTLGNILIPVDWIKESKHRARFVRNSVFLLKDILSHNLHFQEVLLSLEAMESSERDENDGSAASRALAKKLLKASRQDLTLWAAYACFEASTGNVDVARKIFDTALTSLSALPKEAQTDASAVYLAYAEVEMAQFGNSSQDYQRVLYILHFLGVGEPYQPNFSTLTGTQVLKARRGFNDQLQKIYKLGKLTESDSSLVICAALFQQLTAGWQPATSIFQQILQMPGLDDRRNVHHERLLQCYITMLESQKEFVKPTLIRDIVKEGALQYPFNLKLLTSYKENALANDTRRFIDELSQRNPSSLHWLFALSCEFSSSGASARIRNVFERALDVGGGSQPSVLLWRLYIAYELALSNNDAARRVFFRAIHACPWSKALWIDGFQKMNTVLSVKELSDLVDIMRDKELRIRTDVYEILLEEAG